MNPKGHVFAAAPELLVKRWQESRAHVPLLERNREPWLQAEWLHPTGQPGLKLHWSRLRSAQQ